MHENPAPLVLILPRPMRVIAARLVGRITREDHALSIPAAAAVQGLLADSDRVELTHLEAMVLRSAVSVEQVRLSRAAGQGELSARQQLTDTALGHLREQLDPQLYPIRMGTADRIPHKLAEFRIH